MSRRVKSAVVLGGSLAGLATARALANADVSVTLVERDVLPASAEPRKGVPQGRHVHVLLAAGLAALERLFPGFERDLIARGAVAIDASTEAGLLGQSGWIPRLPDPMRVVSMSRDLLESVVRERLRATSGVQILDGRRIEQLMTGQGGVHGTVIDGEQIAAELVVDACGRGSDAPTWLGQAGFEVPPATVVDPHVGCASRAYRDVPAMPNGWRLLFLMCKVEFPRAALFVPNEGGTYMVSLAGAAHHRPPTDEAGFLAFARSLRSPLLAEVMEASTPVGPILANRSTKNRWRHYERLERTAAGFVPVGDAMCAFNPGYGQGITVASLEAEILGQAVADGVEPARLAYTMPRRFAKICRSPWLSAISQDTRVATTTIAGERPPFMRGLDWYGDALWEVATVDADIAAALWRAYHLVGSPTELVKPSVLARVAAWRLGRRRPAPIEPHSLAASAAPGRRATGT